MRFYWFNRQELLQKAKDKYHNYGGKDEDVIKVKANNKYNNLTEEEKEATRKYQQDRYKKSKENQADFVKYNNELLLV